MLIGLHVRNLALIEEEEMTFTPGVGNYSYKSEGTDEYLGTLLTLPKASPMPRI